MTKHKLIERRDMLLNMIEILTRVATPKALTEVKHLTVAYEAVLIELKEIE